MNFFDVFNADFAHSRLSAVVRKYGPDFLSNVGGGLLAAAGVMTMGAAGPLVTIPAAILLICAVNKISHDQQEREYLASYDDQIAVSIKDDGNAMGHRDPRHLTTADLRNVAFGKNTLSGCPNNILRDKVKDNDWQMYSSVILHGISGVLFMLLAGAVPFLANMGMGATLGVGAGALLVFQQLDKVVTDIGRTLLDTERPKAHERIMELEKELHDGEKVTPLKVFSVMVDGDRRIAKAIRQEKGMAFADLYLDDKFQMMRKYGAARGIDELTEALNTGKLEAPDLVLALCDQPAAMRHGLPRRRFQAAKPALSGEQAYNAFLSGAEFGPAEGATPHFFRDMVSKAAERIAMPGSKTIN